MAKIEKEEEKSTSEHALTIVILLALMFYKWKIMLDGWVWFAIPLGLPDVSYWHVAGVSSLIALMTMDVMVIRREITIGFCGTLLFAYSLTYGGMYLLSMGI